MGINNKVAEPARRAIKRPGYDRENHVELRL